MASNHGKGKVSLTLLVVRVSRKLYGVRLRRHGQDMHLPFVVDIKDAIQPLAVIVPDVFWNAVGSVEVYKLSAKLVKVPSRHEDIVLQQAKAALVKPSRRKADVAQLEVTMHTLVTLCSHHSLQAPGYVPACLRFRVASAPLL